MAGGIVLVDVAGDEEMLFSEHFACVHCGISMGELEPRTFSFNNPHGACSTCTGLGYKLEVDPDLAIPDRKKSIVGGAIEPWSRTGTVASWNLSQLESLGREFGFEVDDPIETFTKKQLNALFRGTGRKRIRVTHKTQRGRTYRWDTRFEGVLNNLERRYMETESDHVRPGRHHWRVEHYLHDRQLHISGAGVDQRHIR